MAAPVRSLATELRECPISGLAVAHGGSGLKVSCPKCKHNTVVDSGKLSDLPGNFLLGEVKAALDEHTRYTYCFYCNTLGKETRAFSQCMKCRRYMCEDCSQKHKKNPRFAHHEILTFTDENKEVCSKHNVAAVFICRACSPVRLLCDICLTLDDSCHDPEGFEEYTSALDQLLSELNVDIDVDDKVSKVESKEQMLMQQVQRNVDVFIKHIEATKNAVMSEIKKHFDVKSLHLAANAVKESKLRAMEIMENNEKRIDEVIEAAMQFTRTVQNLSKEEERAMNVDPNHFQCHKEEEYVAGTDGAYMKLGLFALPPKMDKAGQETSAINAEKRNPVQLDPKTLDTNFDIGSFVEINVQRNKVFGIIRWIGYYGDRDSPIAGIELEQESKAGTDGTYMNTRLFKCPPNRATFTHLSHCRPDSRDVQMAQEYSGHDSRNVHWAQKARNIMRLDTASFIRQLKASQLLEELCRLDVITEITKSLIGKMKSPELQSEYLFHSLVYLDERKYETFLRVLRQYQPTLFKQLVSSNVRPASPK